MHVSIIKNAYFTSIYTIHLHTKFKLYTYVKIDHKLRQGSHLRLSSQIKPIFQPRYFSSDIHISEPDVKNRHIIHLSLLYLLCICMLCMLKLVIYVMYMYVMYVIAWPDKQFISNRAYNR